MRLFHSTTGDAAEEIAREGFRDVSASYNASGELCHGVWFADRVMTDAFSLAGVVLTVEIPGDVAESFEWPDDHGASSNWRAFLIPASVLNGGRTFYPTEPTSPDLTAPDLSESHIPDPADTGS